MKKFYLIILLIHQLVYSQNVTLDTAFGNGGHVITPNTSEILKLDLFSDGKIIAVGYTNTVISTSYHHLTLAKYNVNGTLESSFGTNGIVNTNIGYSELPNAVYIQTDDKILVAGNYRDNSYTETQTGSGAFLVRYNADGSLDTGFGVNGIIKTNFISNSPIYNFHSISLLSDNSIIVSAGCKDPLTNLYVDALVKFNPDGSFASNFGTNGILPLYFPGTNGISIYSFKVLPDDTILCCGSQNTAGIDQSMMIEKLNSDGTINTAFGVNGMRKVETSIDTEYCTQMFVNNDGTVLLFGLNSNEGFFIKLLPNGDLDSAYGSNGLALTSAFVQNEFQILPNGKILLGNERALAPYVYAVDANFAFSAEVYNSDGTSANSFNAPNNYFNIDFGLYNDYNEAIKLQPDGKLLMGGSSRITSNTSYTNFALTRINLYQNLSNPDFNNTKISLFPNPNNGNFKLNKSENYSIEIFDLLGQNVFVKKGIYSTTDIITNLKKGIYIVKIIPETGKSSTEKLIVK